MTNSRQKDKAGELKAANILIERGHAELTTPSLSAPCGAVPPEPNPTKESSYDPDRQE